MDPYYQQYGYGPQPNAIPVPGPGGAAISGFQSGMNLGQQLHDAWRNNMMNRKSGQYNQAVADQNPDPNAAPHQSFGRQMLNGAEGLANHFGAHFNIPQAGGAIPAAAGAAAPAAAGGGGFFHNLAGMLHMEQGGPVNAAPVPGIGGAAISGFQGGMNMGQQLHDAWRAHAADAAAGSYNQAVADQQPDSGAVPQHSALRTVADHFQNFAHKLFSHGLNDNHVPNSQQAVAPPASAPVPSSPDPSAAPAGAPPAGAAASPPAPPTGGAPSPAAPTAGASSPAPTGPAIPPGLAAASPQQQQGTAQAVQAAATDPAAQQGVPQKAPPHSMTHLDIDHLNKLKYEAVAAAARAGHDPSKVLESLNTVQTSFVQGGIMKNLSAANVALMNGDNKAVEQALKNVNYYLPNGQDLEIHHGADGTMQYRDPFAKPDPDGQQPWVNVDAAHIQLLAANATDPSKVQDIINAAHTAGTKRALDIAKAQADTLNAQGHLLTGRARLQNAETTAGNAPSLRYHNIGITDAALTRANADATRTATAGMQKGTVPFAVAAKAAADGSKAVYDLAQGQPETAPTMDANGNPSLSPAAGKPVRNPEKIPSWLRGNDGKPLDTTTLTGIAALAGKLNAANVGRMSSTDAAELAAHVIKLSHGKMTMHTGKDGKPQADFLQSADGTTGWLWQKGADGKSGTWRQFKMQAETGAAFANGVDQVTPFGSEENGAGDGEAADNYDAEDAADNAPAIEPPSQ